MMHCTSCLAKDKIDIQDSRSMSAICTHTYVMHIHCCTLVASLQLFLIKDSTMFSQTLAQGAPLIAAA